MDMIDITVESHPVLYNALDTISHDGGMGAGHITYAVDARFTEELALFEEQCYMLEDMGRLEDMCIGEHDDMLDLQNTFGLQRLGHFLNCFFGEAEWEDVA